MPDLRSIPSVDQLLQMDEAARLVGEFGRPLTLEAIRFAASECRSAAARGDALKPAKRGQGAARRKGCVGGQ